MLKVQRQGSGKHCRSQGGQCVGILRWSHSNIRVLGTLGGTRVSVDHVVAFQRDSFLDDHINICVQ